MYLSSNINNKGQIGKKSELTIGASVLSPKFGPGVSTHRLSSNNVEFLLRSIREMMMENALEVVVERGWERIQFSGGLTTFTPAIKNYIFK